MTAATSTSKKSFFGVHFRNRIIENKKLLIVNSILELIGLPLIAVIVLYKQYMFDTKQYNNFDEDGIIVVSIISIAISLLSGIIIALFSFRYLYTKSLADMNYSLPLTSKQRFFADYLSGLAIYTVPAAAAALLSVIILGIGSAFVDIDFFWKNLSNLILLGFIVFFGMIMLYTLSVFSITCCGSPFEAVFSIIAANIIIPATVVCTYYAIIETNPFGLTDTSIPYNPLLTATSPAGFVTFSAIYAESVAVGSDYSKFMYIRWLIPMMIVMAALLAGAYLLYRRRKAESISKPYVYKMFYYVIITLAVFCVLAMFIVSDGSVAAGLIICGILYFLLEVISKRGFRRFWTSALRYAATVAAVFIFCAVCKSTDGFGVSKYVPRNAAVDSVSINIGNYGDFNVNSEIIFDDKKVISETTALQKELINRYFHPDKYDFDTVSADDISDTDTIYSHYSYEDISITYYLKNGAAVMREYSCSSDVLDGLITALCLSDEYADYKANEMLLNCVNIFNKKTWYTSIDDIRETDRATVSLTDKLLRNGGKKSISLDEMKKLAEAYRQDMLAMTEEEFRTAPVYGYINGGYNYEIRTTFKNTIAVLDGLGFRNPEITEDNLSGLRFGIFTGFEAYNDPGALYRSHYSYDYDLPEEYNLQDKFVSYFVSSYISYPTVPVNNIKFDDDFMTLIERATPVIVGENAAGAVFVETDAGQTTLFLPDTEENSELLQRVYDKYMKGKATYSDDSYVVYQDDSRVDSYPVKFNYN